MAKKRTNKQNTRNTFTNGILRPRNILLIFTALLILAWSGMEVRTRVNENQKEARLSQAGYDLDKYADNIRQKGLDILLNKAETCRYASEKFDKGKLYCEQKLAIEATYRNKTELTQLTGAINNSFYQLNESFFITNSNSKQLVTDKGVANSQSLKHRNGISCQYFSNKNELSGFSDKNTLKIEVSCFKDLSKPIYQIEN